MPATILANNWKMDTSACLPAIPINPARAVLREQIQACDADSAFETFATDLMEYVGLRVEDLGDRNAVVQARVRANE